MSSMAMPGRVAVLVLALVAITVAGEEPANVGIYGQSSLAGVNPGHALPLDDAAAFAAPLIYLTAPATEPDPVPEPSTLLLLAVGAAAGLRCARRPA